MQYVLVIALAICIRYTMFVNDEKLFAGIVHVNLEIVW